MFLLYKIYYDGGKKGEQLAYLGRTRQPLKRRLHGHFFKKRLHKAVNIHKVCRIEYAEFATCADMYLYEIYYINKLHPLLNKDDLAPDELTITLPDVPFQPFECDLMDKWKAQVDLLREAEREKRQQRELRRAAKAAAQPQPPVP